MSVKAEWYEGNHRPSILFDRVRGVSGRFDDPGLCEAGSSSSPTAYSPNTPVESDTEFDRTGFTAFMLGQAGIMITSRG